MISYLGTISTPRSIAKQNKQQPEFKSIFEFKSILKRNKEHCV